MILSAFGQMVLPGMRFPRSENPAIPLVPNRGSARPQARAGATHDRAHAGTRRTHDLLADASGVWAWTPGQWQTAAMRHHDLHDWIERHPSCDVRLWVSGELLRSVGPGEGAARPDESLPVSARNELVRRHGDDAANWALTLWTSEVAQGACALAGIDLEALIRHARGHHVQIRSVVPWWYHGFTQAKRCVNALNASPSAEVGVVEGRQLVWVSLVRGLLADVRQVSLADASVRALDEAIGALRPPRAEASALPVVLGQGLADGAQTRRLKALVLGRLDGDQPPNWLRPDAPAWAARSGTATTGR